MNATGATRPGVLLALLAIAACGGGSGGASQAPPPPPPAVVYEYQPPAANGDGWAVASLADEGFDEAAVVSTMNLVLNGDSPGIDAVAIARNGRLLLYWYDTARVLDQFDAWIDNQSKERHVLHSTSKSVTAILVGIAMDQGHIGSTDLPFYDFFSYSSYGNPDPRKATMTLEDALTMRAGYEWDEWSEPYTSQANDLVRLEANHLDWPKALLDLPMAQDPGTVFAYNTALTIAIGQALENATGMPMADFANTYLFAPLQIVNADWWLTPTGLPVGGSGLFLKPRDLAKIGQLWLDGGTWNGQRIVSADWVAATITPHVDVSGIVGNSEAYGYQWWLDELSYAGQPVETWITSGYGGQYLFVIPSLELVVAFTGHNYTNAEGIANLFRIVQSRLLPALD